MFIVEENPKNCGKELAKCYIYFVVQVQAKEKGRFGTQRVKNQANKEAEILPIKWVVMHVHVAAN